jgi:adhesin transport system outer membrane protein
MRSSLLAGSAAVLFACGIQHAVAQSLRESVAGAIETNPRVGGVVDNRQAVDAELRRARGLYLPQLDFRSGDGPEYSDNQFTRTSGNAFHLRQELSAVLTQRLFDGGEADGTVDQQIGRSRSAAFRVRETSEFVALDAVQAHLDLVRLHRILNLAEGNLNVHRDVLERVRRRASGGAGTQADIDQALSRLEEATADRDETMGALRQAEATYLNVVGREAGTPLDVEPPVNALPVGLDASLKIAEDSNPTVKIREADVEAAQAEIEVASSRFLPTVNLEVGGEHNRDVTGFPQTDNEARALVTVHWNLYAGGSDTANRDAAYGHLSQAKQDRLQALREADEGVRRALADYESGQKRIANLRQAVQHNIAVRTAYEEQYQLGQRTLIELLDSANELFTSQTRLASAEEATTSAAFHVLALDGLLLKLVGVDAPLEADPAVPAPRPKAPAEPQKGPLGLLD